MDKKIIKTLNDDEKKIWICNFTKEFIEKNKVPPSCGDFARQGISSYYINKLFINMGDLTRKCGFEYIKRKQNLSDDELKKWIESIKDNDCSNKCSVKLTTCWVTSKLCCKLGTKRPLIQYKSKLMLLARLVFKLYNNNFDPKLDVLHTCDNEACFNPEHLMQGTAKKNAEDREVRGRGNHVGPRAGFKRHGASGPDDPKLGHYIKSRVITTERNEWLWPHPNKYGYAVINVKNKTYMGHKIMLAQKLGIKYEDIDIACHAFPEDSKYFKEKPSKNDVNPDHLYNGTDSTNSRDALSYSKKLKISSETREKILEEAKIIDFSQADAVFDFDTQMATRFGVSIRSIKKIRLKKGHKGSTKRTILQIDKKTGVIVQRHGSASDAAKLGFSRSAISHALIGDLNSHKGFIWKYEEEK